MARYLHSLSAVLFYLLGLSFFGAYLLWRNEIEGALSLNWLTVADLPLLITGLLYGGTSVYLSIDQDHHSRGLAWWIGLPLLILFIVAAVFNFWPL